MWKPFGSTIAGSQAHTSRVLLAYYIEGHSVLREGVQQMPMLQQHYITTVRTTYPNECFLTIHLMGAQHNGTLPYGNTTSQIPRLKDQLFH